ncbi:MAG: hypothetical protein LUB59_04305 [Candidatus Gastranaerophilales bacterium]|nr:hypothetical protein [Candidatus Gastranaerophilales bacterium]
MSTTISSVNSTTSSSTASTSTKSQISDSTKRQLEALGIDASSVTSESQAQALIAAKQAEQSFQDSLYMSSDDSSSTDSTESSLISEAKSLANQLGVSVASDDTFDDITAAISDAIEKLMDKAGNDPIALQRAQSYQTQLAQLSSQYSTVSSSNSSMYAAMNVQAANNKYMLGL